MATDIERLTVQLEASTVKYERAMARALGQTNRTVRSIETRFKGMSGFVGSQMARAGGALAGGAFVASAQMLIDANTRIINSLKVSGVTGDALGRTYDRLAAIAQKSGASFESLASLYGRAAGASKELGASGEELIQFTEGVSNALRVAGTTTEQASGALLQLGQALGSSRVQAEEFGSILDGGRPILQAVADNILEAGGSISKLKQLVIDGKVSNQLFFRAFLQGTEELEKRAGAAKVTIQGEFENLKTEAIRIAGEIDKTFGVSDDAAAGIRSIASAIRDLPNALNEAMPLLTGLAEVLQTIADLYPQAGQLGKSIGDQLGTSSFGPWLNEQMGKSGKAFRTGLTDKAPTTVSQLSADLGLDDFNPYRSKGPGRSPTGPAKQPPIPVDRYPVVGGTGSKDKETPFARDARQIREETAEILAQQRAYASLNPFVNDYGFAVEKAKAEAELLAAAQKEGLAITPALQAEIAGLAEQYAQATVELEQTREAQQRLVEAWDMVGEGAWNAFEGVITGAESAKDAVLDLIKQILLAEAKAQFMGLFGGGSGGSGPISTILGSLFGGAREGGGPVSAGRAYVVGEKRPELFVPSQSGVIIPRLSGLARGGAATSSRVMVEVFVDDDGKLGAIARAAGSEAAQTQIKVYDKRVLPGRMQQIRQFGRRRG